MKTVRRVHQRQLIVAVHLLNASRTNSALFSSPCATRKGNTAAPQTKPVDDVVPRYHLDPRYGMNPNRAYVSP
jgi:hypothetical protein